MRALEGMKVLDFSVGHDASAATMYLADHGAEVIKVENLTTGGDIARAWEPIKNGKSAYFELLNRGKKSVALDFEEASSIEKIKKLIKNTDIVVENLPVNRFDELGLSYDELKEINPQVIYVKVSPFGNTGPKRECPLYDYTAFAYGGYLQMTGLRETMPSVPYFPIISYSVAHFVSGAIDAAYIARMTTGRGQMVDISIADCVVGLLEDRYASIQYEGLDSERVGNAHPTIVPYDTIECKGGFINMSPSTQKMWEDMCTVLGFPEIMHVEKYNDPDLRHIQYFHGDLKTRMVNSLSKYTPEEATKLLNDVGIPAAPVFTLEEAYNCDQYAAKGVIVEKEDAILGKYAVASANGQLFGTPQDLTSPAPMLGANTEDVLNEL